MIAFVARRCSLALLRRVAVARGPHGSELADVEPSLADGDDVHVPVVGVVMADGKPLDASTEILVELSHHLLRPPPKVELPTSVLDAKCVSKTSTWPV